MSAILLTFAYFLLGMIAGAVLLFVLWKHHQARLMADVFKKMLAEQGYTIKDKRIVPVEEGQRRDDIESELEKAVREVLEGTE